MKVRIGRCTRRIALTIGLLGMGLALGGCELLWPTPGIPTGVEASDGTVAGRIVVTWNSVERATRYEIWRAESEDGPYIRVGETTETFFSDDDVTPNVIYWYLVEACNWDGCSPASAADSGYAPATFSGRGDRVTDTFVLAEGLVTFDLRHTGQRHFAVWLYDTRGNRVDLLVNVIGPYSGTVLVGVRADSIRHPRPGPHLLEIQADGTWEVMIRPLRVRSGAAMPWVDQGTGDSVSSPFVLPVGTFEFTFHHTGRSNFIVWLYTADGRRVDLLVNEIGAYSGSRAVGVRSGAVFGPTPGVHVLAISADGQWSVAARQR